MTERIFGNRSEFGIRYIPGWKSKDNRYYFATLHLVLNDQIIGDKDETCMVGSWIHYMERNLKLLVEDFEKLYHNEFDKKTDLEIFELIYKSNQLEDEYNPDYLYLSVLPNEIWVNCNVNIDETIDAYLLTMLYMQDQIKFIWKGCSEPCPVERPNKLFSISLNRILITDTISECINFVKRDLETYKTK